jgi:3-deoxy-7-phosphoheptulonate synthase
MQHTHDLRVQSTMPLSTPDEIKSEIPLDEAAADHVVRARAAIEDIVHGQDRRLLVIVGPCSIHDPSAAIEYAGLLQACSERYADSLLLCMRGYFEKPRTATGWKGLINDPHLDGSCDMGEGLRIARRLLRTLAGLGLPIANEALDPVIPQYLADLVAWSAIGARTTESQTHREMASGLSMPVGFKNGTAGTVRIAIDAVRSSAHPHHFLSVTKQGLAAIVSTAGNPECHVILRGGSQGPNYGAEHVNAVSQQLTAAGAQPRLMVDCSHANSGKQFERQADVLRDVAAQVAGGSDAIFGIMLESFLEDGRQDAKPGKQLVFGQSITDACMGWERTEPLFEELAAAVRARRAKR